ncbi:hypothetical protein CCICO_08415 [Corynebacterium ciconiae DSM 44920]|nr:hypothetical protein CCICO_08415 [Corynebacterium ciconiae DSM 44920]
MLTSREKTRRADGTFVFRSPARNDYATLKVCGINVPVGARSRKLLKIPKRDLSKGIQDTPVFKQKQLAIPVDVL